MRSITSSEIADALEDAGMETQRGYGNLTAFDAAEYLVHQFGELFAREVENA